MVRAGWRSNDSTLDELMSAIVSDGCSHLNLSFSCVQIEWIVYQRYLLLLARESEAYQGHPYCLASLEFLRGYLTSPFPLRYQQTPRFPKTYWPRSTSRRLSQEQSFEQRRQLP